MRAKVAVATVQGKAYYTVVNELKKRNIPFVSIIPGEPVPVEVKVAITTGKEKTLVDSEKVLVYDPGQDPEVLGSQVVKALQGKDAYGNVIIGVDPGEVFGLAVLADGTLIDSENCLSLKEVEDKIKSVLKAVDLSKSMVAVKIGSGVPIYHELVEALDEVLPPQVTFEIVEEAGTNRYAQQAKHGRISRHIGSAIRIAGRLGHIYSRRQPVEANG